MRLKFTLLCSLLSISLNVFCQLVPDSSFSSDGYFITNSANAVYTPRIMELNDGSILTAGSSNSKFRLWKYNAAGQAVSSFGMSGEASNSQLDNELGYVFRVQDIDTTTDGKIIILAEQSVSNATIYDSTKAAILIIRFNANGTVDNTFNSTGYLIDHPVSGFQYHPMAMGIDKSTGVEKNSIYVGSWVYETGHASCPLGFGKWCLSKYLSNGAKDMSFNSSTGYIQESSTVINQGPTGSPLATIHDLKVLPSGSVVVSGAMHYFDSAFFSFRILPNGQWDNTYGTNGRSIHHVSFEVPSNDLTNSQVLNDGSSVYYTILRWFGTPGSTPDSSVLRVVKTGPSGLPISSFGSAGVLLTSYLSGQYPILLFKSDQSFLLTYYRTYGALFADQKIEFKHFLSNGSINNSFGINGLLKTQPIAPDPYINSSQVLQAIWNKNETSIFLAATNQKPGTQGNSEVVKYKWPGLTPLSNNNFDIVSDMLVYPNPITRNDKVFIEHQSELKSLKLYSLTGSSYLLSNLSLGNGKEEINIPSYISTGIYSLVVETNSGRFVKKIEIK